MPDFKAIQYNAGGNGRGSTVTAHRNSSDCLAHPPICSRLNALRKYAVSVGSSQLGGSPRVDFIDNFPAVEVGSTRPPLKYSAGANLGRAASLKRRNRNILERLRSPFSIFALISMLGLVFPISIWASSLSDINVPAFKKKEEGPSEGTRSPFVPARPTIDELSVEELVLTGIVIGKEKAFALISGYIVQVGDRIAGYKVSSIDARRVVLQKMDQTYILSLGGEI